MFTIHHNGELFFDPRVDGYPLGAPELLREANKIGTLTFTIFPPNPDYRTIKMLRSVFSVYKDGALIYQGRPAYRMKRMKGAVEYKCEELTACMNDYKLRPMTYSGPVDQLFMAILSSFNNRSQSVTFNPGYIQNPGEIEWSETYIGHWDALQKLVTQFGGYIIPRYESGQILLDWLAEDDLPESSQSIRFGENLKDMFLETDTNETFSGIIPLGGVPQGETDKITIESVNGGSDVLYNDDAADLYGWRETVKEWKDVTDPETLKGLAEEWLRGNGVKFRDSVQISAIDLHNADLSIESFEYLHWITAESSRHDLHARYILSREETPLDRPVGTQITLGSAPRTITT